MDDDKKLDWTVQNTLEDVLDKMYKCNYGDAQALLEKLIWERGTHEEVGYRG